MKRNKIPYIIISLSALIYVSFFQNCSQSAKFSSTSSTESTVAPSETTPPFASEITPVELKLIHTPGRRDFSTKMTGLSITDSNCKLQYLKDETIWTDFTSEFLCNTDINSGAYSLPIQDNWTNNFTPAKPGVQIRLIKSNSSKVIGVFSQLLTCAKKSPSLTETPNIDENCDGKWDDKVDGPDANCDSDSSAITFNSTYSCEPTKTCDGKVAKFLIHSWRYFGGFFSAPDCNPYSYLLQGSGISAFESSKTLTGITPKHGLTGGCQDWESRDSSNNVINGYTQMYESWGLSRCVYSYPQYTNYY